MIRKTFLSIVALATMGLTACGPSPQQQAYQQGYQAAQQQQVQTQVATQQASYGSVQECQSDPNNPNPGLCAASFAQAQAALPHYYSASSCDSLYSNCQNYGGWWGPAFAGFMLGSYMNGGYHPYPLYVGHDGYLYGNGYSLGYRPVRSYYGGVYHYGAPAHTVFVIHSQPTTAYRTAVPATAYAHTISAPPPVRTGGFGATGAKAQLTSQTRPVGPAPVSTAPRPVVSAFRPGSNGASATRPAMSAPPRPAVMSISRPSGGSGGFSRPSGGGGFHRH